MSDDDRKDKDQPEQKHYSWKDGLPTGPEVAELQKRWPSLKAGDRIEYSEIEEAIGIVYPSSRWTTVTNAWRKREEEKGNVIDCVAGAAFFVATSDQISAKTYGTLRHIGRSAKKQRRQLSTITTSDERTKVTIDHQARLMLAIEQDARKKRMNILPATETKQPPRIEPPKKNGSEDT